MNLLICPNCREILRTEGRVMRCANGHSFDVAREGYVNLLTGQAPRGLAGDSAEMIAARRAWLARGHYEFLAAGLREAVQAGGPRVVADFGCGEGYYLDYVLRGLDGAAGYGTDISKPAIAAAAKAYPGLQFIVADTNKLIPLADSSVDAGMCVFAPRSASEFARVIKPGGRLVIAIPSDEHLASLRKRFGLIGIEADKTAKITEQLAEGFVLEMCRPLQGEAVLDNEALNNLIEMTPNARHIDNLKRSALDEAEQIQVEFRFEILTFTRILSSNEVSQNYT